jgi:hypothetical protein
VAAAISAGVGWAIKLTIGIHHPIITAAAILLPYGITYFVVTALLKVPELNTVLGRILRLARHKL